MRILIAGYPNSGKTTIARILYEITSGPIWSTDTLLDNHDWSELSAEVARWIDKPHDWIIEGVAVPRAVRKWKKLNPEKRPPIDMLIYVRRSFAGFRPGQVAMAKGGDTVMIELWKWLKDNGVAVFEIGPKAEE